MPADTAPKVSVCVVTYNHAGYIAQALDGILAQTVAFPLEILVADDCSTDGTRAIVEGYAARFPQIRVLPRPHNLGAAANVIDVLRAARGEYVAYLEGDDYWLGTTKLQKQVDFLDAHPDHVTCFHNALIDSGAGVDESSPRLLPPWERQSWGLTDLLTRGNFVPSCSLMYRNHLLPKFPDWYARQRVGDWTLHVLHAQHGLFGQLDETMAVARHHAGGTWTGGQQQAKLLAQIEAYEAVDAHLGHAYHHLLRGHLASLHLALVEPLAARGDRRAALSHYAAGLRLLPSWRHGRPLVAASLALSPPVLGAFRKAKEAARSLRG